MSDDYEIPTNKPVWAQDGDGVSVAQWAGHELRAFEHEGKSRWSVCWPEREQNVAVSREDGPARSLEDAKARAQTVAEAYALIDVCKDDKSIRNRFRTLEVTEFRFAQRIEEGGFSGTVLNRYPEVSGRVRISIDIADEAERVVQLPMIGGTYALVLLAAPPKTYFEMLAGVLGKQKAEDNDGS